MNKGITAALTAIGAAQLLKPTVKYWNTGSWNWGSLLETGGMPSSHTAGVVSLATYIAFKKGTKTIDFALSIIFGMIVMYDAMGVRRHAGEIANEDNMLGQELHQMVQDYPNIVERQQDKELIEMLSHIPAEVLAGAMLGTTVGAAAYAMAR